MTKQAESRPVEAAAADGKADNRADSKGEARATPEMRKASLLVSSLVLTSDSALESFRKRRAGDPALDVQHLARARDLLDAIAQAITAKDPTRWEAIERAWSALEVRSAARAEDAALADESVDETDIATIPPPAPPSTPGSAGTPRTPGSAGTPRTPGSAGTPRTPGSAGTPRTPGSAGTPRTPGTPEPPPRVGDPMPDEAPRSLEVRSKPSPWVTPVAAAQASAPASRERAPTAPLPAPGERGVLEAARDAARIERVDIEALNRIKLDAEEPGTMPADWVKMTGKPLPFTPDEKKPPPPPLSDDTPHMERDPMAETRTAHHDVLETLPFKKAELRRDDDAPPSSQPTAMRDYAPTERLSPAVMPPPSEHGAAMASGAHFLSDILTPSPAAPSPAASSPVVSSPIALHLQAMTVEQYAALCAECAVRPMWMAQIHARYGIRSGDERAALDAHWRAQIGADPQIANSYRWHFARYEEWAKSRG